MGGVSSSGGLELAVAYGQDLLDDVAVLHPGLGPGGDGGAQPELVAAEPADVAGDAPLPALAAEGAA